MISSSKMKNIQQIINLSPIGSEKSNQHQHFLDSISQFTYQLQMKNRAKEFITKIKKEKQIYHGKYLLARKKEQQRKLKNIERQINDSLQRLRIEKRIKQDQISARIKLRKEKISMPKIKYHKMMQQQKGEQKNPIQKVLKGKSERMKTIIKTEPDEPAITSKRESSYSTISDQRLINKIKKKRQQLSHLSQI